MRLLVVHHVRRGRRRAERVAQRNDDTAPEAGVEAAIIALRHISGEIALENHGAEVVADQGAQRELALFYGIKRRLVEVARPEAHRAELPLAELLGRRQVDVDVVRIY